MTVDWHGERNNGGVFTDAFVKKLGSLEEGGNGSSPFFHKGPEMGVLEVHRKVFRVVVLVKGARS